MTRLDVSCLVVRGTALNQLSTSFKFYTLPWIGHLEHRVSPKFTKCINYSPILPWAKKNKQTIKSWNTTSSQAPLAIGSSVILYCCTALHHNLKLPGSNLEPKTAYHAYTLYTHNETGMQWRSWLRRIRFPDGVIGNFHRLKPSGHTMALGSTEMSTRNISRGGGGGRGGRRVGFTTSPPIAWKSGSLNLLEPSGPIEGLLTNYTQCNHGPLSNLTC